MFTLIGIILFEIIFHYSLDLQFFPLQIFILLLRNLIKVSLTNH